MFPLFQKEAPANAKQLADALSASLRHVLEIARDPVVVQARTFPDLDEIAIDLSGAKMRMNATRPPFPPGEGERAISARNLNLVARPVSIAGAAVNLALEAQNIVLHQNRDAEGNVFLLLHDADSGRIGVSISLEDLETLVTEVAKTEAGKHGIVIEDVLLNLTSKGNRSVGAELRVQARKLFVRTTIRISGQMKIDDELVARLSDVNCSGEGAIGTMACGILTPHLQKLEAREFPLLAFSLGQLRLRDLELVADRGIKIAAEFGTGPASQLT